MNPEEKTENDNMDMKNNILGEIRSGVVLMRPKASFTFKLILLIFLVSLITGVSIFILNLIVFSARINHYDALLGFGASGLYTFIKFFPWYLMMLDVVLILLLLALVRKFRFGYKIPVLYLLSGIFASTILFAVALDFGTELNESLLKRSDKLPGPIEKLYLTAEKRIPSGSGICFCKIISIDGNTLVAEDNRNAGFRFKVLFPSKSTEKMLLEIVPGSVVFIAGVEKDGVIEAFGISNINPRIKIGN